MRRKRPISREQAIQENNNFEKEQIILILQTLNPKDRDYIIKEMDPVKSNADVVTAVANLVSQKRNADDPQLKEIERNFDQIRIKYNHVYMNEEESFIFNKTLRVEFLEKLKKEPVPPLAHESKSTTRIATSLLGPEKAKTALNDQAHPQPQPPLQEAQQQAHDQKNIHAPRQSQAQQPQDPGHKGPPGGLSLPAEEPEEPGPEAPSHRRP